MDIFVTYFGHEFIPKSDNRDFEGLRSTVTVNSGDDFGPDVVAMNRGK